MPDTLTPEPDTEGLWLSVSGLAKRKGVAKQSISERVAKLRALNKLETRPGPGRSTLVNVAQYDLAVGEVGDGVKELAAETVRALRGEPEAEPDGELPLAPADPTLRDAQAANARYSAELKKLELAERRRLLVPVAHVLDAADTIAQAQMRALERIELRAGELAALVAKDGEAGARAFLRTLRTDLRKDLAGALREVAQVGRTEESQGLIAVEVPDES